MTSILYFWPFSENINDHPCGASYSHSLLTTVRMLCGTVIVPLPPCFARSCLNLRSRIVCVFDFLIASLSGFVSITTSSSIDLSSDGASFSAILIDARASSKNQSSFIHSFLNKLFFPQGFVECLAWTACRQKTG